MSRGPQSYQKERPWQTAPELRRWLPVSPLKAIAISGANVVPLRATFKIRGVLDLWEQNLCCELRFTAADIR